MHDAEPASLSADFSLVREEFDPAADLATTNALPAASPVGPAKRDAPRRTNGATEAEGIPFAAIAKDKEPFSGQPPKPSLQVRLPTTSFSRGTSAEFRTMMEVLNLSESGLEKLSSAIDDEIAIRRSLTEKLKELTDEASRFERAALVATYFQSRFRAAQHALSNFVEEAIISDAVQRRFFDPVASVPGRQAGSKDRPNDGLITRRARTIAASGLFDEAFYLSQFDCEVPETTSPIEHYLREGWTSAKDPNPLFSTRYYLFQYPDILESDLDPFSHFVEHGSRELRNPHPLFATKYYADQHGSTPSGESNWLARFLADASSYISPHPIFDSKEYALRAAIESQSARDALLHYVTLGWKQGIDPSPMFRAKHYRAQTGWHHADMEPYTHYIMFGVEHGLDPHALFDEKRSRMLANVPLAHHDPLFQYMSTERKLHVSTCDFFDLPFYTERYKDEVGARGALWHYLAEGARKDYVPHPRFDPIAYRARFMSHVSPEDNTGALEHVVVFTLGRRTNFNIHEVLSDLEPGGEGYSGKVGTLVAASEASFAKKASGREVRNYPGKVAHKEGRPNVLLVAHMVGDHFFGSERSFLDMLQGLAGCDCNIFACLPRNVPDYTNLVRLHCERVFVFDFSWWRKLQPCSELARETFEQLIREHSIDVVHANTIMVRECLEAARKCKVIAVSHARELVTQDRDLADLIGMPAAGIVAEVVDRSDWVIGNSRATADAFSKVGRTLVIPNTVDTDTLNVPNRVDGERIRFGLISSNVPKKGLADIAEIARICATTAPRAEFHIIGPETKYTREMRDGGSLPSNLIFAGYAETPKDAVSQVHVVLSLSHFAESFGRTVLEAMAASRPVIAYAWGAVKELVAPGETGFLVPFKDAKAVAERVKEICDKPDLIDKFGKNARRAATQNFGLDAYRSSFRKAYSAILPGRVEWFETPLHPVVKPARRAGIKVRHAQPRIAYFCWHFPVPSETFVLNELRVLVNAGADVLVFCRQIPHPDFKVDFPITMERINTPEELARRLLETRRTIVHAHFTFPTVTNMVWPACEAAQIPFTFIAHAQDIFVYKNAEQNRLADIGKSPLCRAMFTLSKFHHDFVVNCGFPSNKVIINPNAVDLTRFAAAATPATESRSNRRVVAIHRFVEKKGLSALIRAAALISDLGITIDIYGYGPLEAEYRQIVAAAGLTNATIHGPLTQAQIPAVLTAADLFACPSVRTATGDMDGIPTSMVESMAARVPVLATGIGGIPDLVEDGITGILCEPTPESIADAIRRYYAMDTLQVRAMIDEASRRVTRRHDAVRLVDTLRRVWENTTVDIVIVAWNNLADLRMVVGAILANTATPYHLIICDNMSQKEPVGAYLDNLWETEDRVTVVHNNRNAMVGPGTNLAMAQGNSDHIIYVCGKEGVSFANGWEMSFVRAFDADDIGLVGSLGYSPTYLTGEQYPAGIRLFDKFRNRDFATSNPKRIFRHVQGGLFAISRRMVDQIGGFSDEVPHDYTDVEYSFYAESRGWRLAEADHVLALFNKSRPTLSQRFREDITVAHPVLPDQLPTFNALVRGELRHCNICDWFGDGFTAEGSGCPQCGCGPQDRTLFRWLSDSTYLFRRLPALAVGLEGKMQDVWSEQFQGPRLTFSDFADEVQKQGRLPNSPGRLHIAAVRAHESDASRMSIIAKELVRLLMPGGQVLFQVDACDVGPWEALQDVIADGMVNNRFKEWGSERYASGSIGYSYLPVRIFRKH